MISSKLPCFCKNFSVIEGTGQIFKCHQQNCLIFAKTLPRDNRGSLNIQITLITLGYFRKTFNSWLQGQHKFSGEWIYLNCLVFMDPSHRDNRASSSFPVISSKNPYFYKISTRDDWERSCFQATSSCYVLCYTVL